MRYHRCSVSETSRRSSFCRPAAANGWRTNVAAARRSPPQARGGRRVTSPSPGSSGARGKRTAPAVEERPGPGRRGRIAHPQRRQCAAEAPVATR
eukprot:scaffold19667_cov70-Phaeocystis_antarctica.AAC.4